MTCHNAKLAAETVRKHNLNLRCRLLSQVHVSGRVSSSFCKVITVNSKAVGCVALRINVHNCHGVPSVSETSSQTDGCSRFSAAPFLISKGDNFRFEQWTIS